RVANDFDFTRCKIRIDGAFRTMPHHATNMQAVLVANTFGNRKGGFIIRVDDNLRQAGAITEINEDDATMVASAMYPAGQADGLIDVFGIDLAGVAGTHQGILRMTICVND